LCIYVYVDEDSARQEPCYQLGRKQSLRSTQGVQADLQSAVCEVRISNPLFNNWEFSW
jgi:hypothetical protein